MLDCLDDPRLRAQKPKDNQHALPLLEASAEKNLSSTALQLILYHDKSPQPDGLAQYPHLLHEELATRDFLLSPSTVEGGNGLYKEIPCSAGCDPN
mmetsp:Transcript_9608/g.21860  ORF Transcript_9608/g.21860 Transcript_9608/m.21860 type:complete len:96 (-) Transcript_9608:782-1069(-)